MKKQFLVDDDKHIVYNDAEPKFFFSRSFGWTFYCNKRNF